MNANQIRKLLESKGLTQVDVAGRIGISPQAVHQIITGHTTSATARFAFACAIEMDPEDIWPRKEKPRARKKGAA